MAIIMVVLAHAAVPGFVTGGLTGVTLFFGLSGFLITTLLLQEHQDTGTIRLPQFYLRRILRLYPALIFLVIAATAFEVRSGAPSIVRNQLIVLSYMTDLVRAIGGSAGMLDNTWSLSVEEHFYVIWPVVVLALASRAHNPRKAIALAAAGGALLSMTIRLVLYLHHPSVSDPRIEFAFDTRCDAIFVGCMTAAVLGEYKLRFSWRSVGLPAVAVLAILTAITEYGYTLDLPLAAIASSVLVATAATQRSRALESRHLVWIGRRSYGIYLWHVPMFWEMSRLVPAHGIRWTLLGVGVIAPVSVLIAAVSYKWVERPALVLKSRFESQHLRVWVDEARSGERARPTTSQSPDGAVVVSPG